MLRQGGHAQTGQRLQLAHRALALYQLAQHQQACRMREGLEQTGSLFGKQRQLLWGRQWARDGRATTGHRKEACRGTVQRCSRRCCVASARFAAAFQLSHLHRIDLLLLGGAALFGIGWGLAGYCPGPAIAGLGVGSVEAMWLVPAMLAGSLLHRVLIAGDGGQGSGTWSRNEQRHTDDNNA